MTAPDPTPVRPVEYLNLDALVAVCRRRGLVAADVGLLPSAAARPAITVMGQDAYPTLAAKTAALMHAIAWNRVLVDGNKRLTFFAAWLFLGLNGAELDMTEDELFDLITGIAGGALRDVDSIATKLRISAK